MSAEINTTLYLVEGTSEVITEGERMGQLKEIADNNHEYLDDFLNQSFSTLELWEMSDDEKEHILQDYYEWFAENYDGEEYYEIVLSDDALTAITQEIIQGLLKKEG